jgi:hypothetical protein
MLLCSPLGQVLPLTVAHPRRPASLEGLRIGLLDNTKAPVDRIMEYLAARIGEKVRDVTLFHVAKQHPSLPAEPEVFAALAANADVVINALGD